MTKVTKNNSLMLNHPKFNELSPTAKRYARLMAAQNGVPFIQGRPGTAKTAVVEQIAKTLGFQYFDLRVAELDETEIGSYPEKVVDEETGKSYLTYVLPEWALDANKQPTIIVCDELNRAQPHILNAFLKILNERRIGNGKGVNFNENVYLIATGNLGDEDGTEVIEFDSAVRGRLIPIKHELNLTSWLEDFGNKNVNSLIVDFLNSSPSSFHPPYDAEEFVDVNPRNWTKLSNYIEANAEDPTDVNEVFDLVSLEGSSFVGKENVKLIKYLSDRKIVSFKDISSKYGDVKQETFTSRVNKLSRGQKSDILNQIKSHGLKNFSKKEFERIVKFIQSNHDDQIAEFLTYTTLNRDNGSFQTEDFVKNHPYLATLQTTFEEIYKKMCYGNSK